MFLKQLQQKVYQGLLASNLVLITSFSLPLYSQQSGDEDFLASLPDQYKKRIELQEQNDSAEVEMLFNSNTSIETNKAILYRLKEELQLLEESFEQDKKNTNELERFGDKFFKTVQSSFMPINNANPGRDYAVGPGDSFTILLTGADSSELKDVFVERNGSIFIKGVGSLNINGKTVVEVEKLMQDFISSKRVGVSSSISLSKMRDKQILVVGASKNPGIYTVSGSSSILSVISVSGGIAKNGSYREILQRRNGKTIAVFDLYDVFINGNMPTHNLISGDSILIKPINSLIPVTGGINFPALFEITNQDNLTSLLEYAGGFSADHHGFDFIEIMQLQSSGYEAIRLPHSDISSYKITPRDAVLVPSFQSELQVEKAITIQGMVNKPGTYLIKEGEKLSEIIKKAGGYKSNAYIYGSSLFRQNVKDQEEYFAQRKFLDSIKFIVSSIGKPGVNITPQALEFLETELKTTPYLGRVVTEFDLDKISIDPARDTQLLDKDMIVIPPLQRVVFLFGDLKNPITLRYEPGFTIKDYLKQAGGFGKSATNNLLVINPNGVSSLYKGTILPFSRQTDIYPGSIIYAPNDTGKLDGVMYVSTIAPILSSLALAAASLNSISD